MDAVGPDTRRLVGPSIVLVLLVVAAFAGCTGGSGGARAEAERQAAEETAILDRIDHVVVTPSIAELAMYETIGLTAAAYDADGNVVPGVNFYWRSSDAVTLGMGDDPYHASVKVLGRASTLGTDADATAYVTKKGGDLYQKDRTGPIISGNANLRVVPGGDADKVTVYPPNMTLAVGEARHVIAFAHTGFNRAPRANLTFSSSGSSIELFQLDGLQAFVRGVSEGEATVTVGGVTVPVRVVPALAVTEPVYGRDVIRTPRGDGQFERFIVKVDGNDDAHIAFADKPNENIYHAAWTGTGWDVSLAARFVCNYQECRFSLGFAPDGRPAMTYTDGFEQPHLALYDPRTGAWTAELVQSAREYGHWAVPTITHEVVFDGYPRASKPTDVAFDAQGVPHVVFVKPLTLVPASGPSVPLVILRHAYKRDGRWVVEDVSGPLDDGTFADQTEKVRILSTADGIQIFLVQAEGGSTVRNRLRRFTRQPGAVNWTEEDLGLSMSFEAFVDREGKAHRVMMMGDANHGYTFVYLAPGQPEQQVPFLALSEPNEFSAGLDGKGQMHIFTYSDHIYKVPDRAWRRAPPIGRLSLSTKPVSGAVDSRGRAVVAGCLDSSNPGRTPGGITLFGGTSVTEPTSPALEVPGWQVKYDRDNPSLLVRQFDDGEAAVLAIVHPWRNDTADHDYRNGLYQDGLVFSRTRDGVSFTPPLRVDVDAAPVFGNVDMRIFGDDVYIVYSGDAGLRSRGTLGFFVRSTDRGATFSAPVNPFPSPPSGSRLPIMSQMAVDPNGYLYFLGGYANVGGTTRLLSLLRSTDGGASFELLPGPDPGDMPPTTTRLFTLPGGEVAFVWTAREGQSGPFSLMYAYSSDHGDTWSPIASFEGIQVRDWLDSFDLFQVMENGDVYVGLATREFKTLTDQADRNYTYTLYLCPAGGWACTHSAMLPVKGHGGYTPGFSGASVFELPSGRYVGVAFGDRAGKELCANEMGENWNSTIYAWRLDGAATARSYGTDHGTYPGFPLESAKTSLQLAEFGSRLWGFWLDDRVRLDLTSVAYNRHVFAGSIAGG